MLIGKEHINLSVSVPLFKSKYIIFNNNNSKIPADFIVVLNNNDDRLIDASRIFPLNHVTNSIIALKTDQFASWYIYISHHVKCSVQKSQALYMVSRTSLR